MHRTILFATDGSAASEKAKAEAFDVARQYDATLHVVSVVDLAVSVPAEVDYGEIADDYRAYAQEAVNDVASEAADAGVTQVETAVLTGRIPEKLRTYISDNDVDMLVVGTHGRSGVSRVLLGSVAEKLLRTATIPVLAVPMRED